MKKIKYLSLIICLMFIPFMNINATEENIEQIEKFNVVAGDNITSSSNVNGSSIVAGDIVSAENTVKGIDAVFGNNVTYKGNSDYALIAGNAVNVNGTINNDSFIFGNVITFDENFKSTRDLFVFGSTVTLKGEITRDVTIFAATVVVENAKVSGNVTVYGSTIDVRNTEVEGKISYNDDAQITIDDASIINTKETYKSDNVQISTTDLILDNIVSYVSTLIVFVALALLLPGMFKKIENKTEELSVSKFISMLGYGLLFLIAIPLIFILLVMITVGIPLSLLLITVYIIAICLSTIFTGYLVGLIVWKKFIKKDINILLVGLIGISIIEALILIPYVGAVVALLSLLLSLSLFANLFTKDA